MLALRPRWSVIASEALGELNTAGFVLVPGALGENITTTGLDRKAWRSGQRWRIGQSAVIEFTKLREPCRTLSRFGPGIQKAVYDAQAQDGDPESRHWGIGGFYAAVIEPGVVRAGLSGSSAGWSYRWATESRRRCLTNSGASAAVTG